MEERNRITRYRRARAIVWTGAVVASIAPVIRVLWSLRAGNDEHLISFEDDFFYYLKIAHTIVTQGRSSFDGLTTTNGFHPLWMAVICAIYRLASGESRIFFAIFGVLLGAL